MQRSIILLLFLVLLATPCLAQSTDIPFTLHNGLIIVEAKIKDDVSVMVVLATGTEHSVTDPGLMKKYDLSAGYTGDGQVTGRNDKIVYFAKVSGVRIGNSKSKDLFLRFGSVAELSKMAGKEIFAALGADFFEGQSVQLDFNNSVVRFLDKTPSELIDSKDPNFKPARATVLRMAPKPGDPFRKTYIVPLVKDVQMNGQKTNLLFDTGIATLLALSSSTGKKAGLNVPAENEPPREERLRCVSSRTSSRTCRRWSMPKERVPIRT